MVEVRGCHIRLVSNNQRTAKIYGRFSTNVFYPMFPVCAEIIIAQAVCRWVNYVF